MTPSGSLSLWTIRIYKNDLSAACSLRLVIEAHEISDHLTDFAVRVGRRGGINQARIERSLAAFRRNPQHVVHFGTDPTLADRFGAFGERLNDPVERWALRTFDHPRAAAVNSRARKLKLFRRFDIQRLTPDRREFRQIAEAIKSGVDQLILTGQSRNNSSAPFDLGLPALGDSSDVDTSSPANSIRSRAALRLAR